MPTPSSPHHRASLLTALLAVAAFGLLVDNTQAQTAQQRRLVLDIELKRDGPVQSGAERGEQQLSQRWQFSALLETDGTPIPYNPLDPEDHRRQLADAQRQAAAVGAAPRAAMPDAQSLQAMQAQAQALQARCGQDSACLMREAATLVSASMGTASPGAAAGSGNRPRMDAATQARMQAYGQAVAACERQSAGKARDACRADARRQAGGGVDAPEDNGPATPYLVFNGIPACQLQLATRIDERVKGSYMDVQGAIQFTETAQGQETRRDEQVCPTLMAVLDTRNGRVWASLNLVPRDVKAVSTREQSNGHNQRHEGRVGLRWREAEDWVGRRLLQLSAGGQDQARLPAGKGQSDVRMSWSFKPA